MDRTGKELNVTGNKIINVEDPRQEQDAATKVYVDRTVSNVVWQVHNYTALTNRDEYVHVINNKEITMANLAPLCEITTDWVISSGKYTYWEADLTHHLLESSCSSNNLWLGQQDLQKKYFAVKYKYRINVDSWIFLLRYLTYKDTKIAFHWEVSNDGERWVPITIHNKAVIKEKKWNGNTHALIFTQERNIEEFPFWRIVIDQGVITSVAAEEPWINLLLMRIRAE